MYFAAYLILGLGLAVGIYGAVDAWRSLTK